MLDPDCSESGPTTLVKPILDLMKNFLSLLKVQLFLADIDKTTKMRTPAVIRD
jgi:hypothetical protein